MATDFELALRGQLGDFMKAYNKAVAQTVTDVVRSTAATIRSRTAGQIKRGFQDSSRLQRTIVMKMETRGVTLKPVARVYSKALYKAKYGRVKEIDLLEVFGADTVVVPARGQWLAIPTPNAPARSGRGSRRDGSVVATPRGSGLDLQFVQSKDPNKAFLVYNRKGQRPIVMYILVRQVTLKKRLDIPREIARATGRVNVVFEKRLATLSGRLQTKFGRGLDRGSFDFVVD